MWRMRSSALLAMIVVGCSTTTEVAPPKGDTGDDPIGAFDVGDLDADDFPDVGFVSPPSRLELGHTVVASPPPPPISGGTLIIAADGHTAIASDPDRDLVWFVDLDTRAITSTKLQAGDEPGRVIEDDRGHVVVALRRGGAIATLDRKTGAVLARDKVCGAPRGLAYEAAGHSLRVACAGGELVTIDLETGYHATVPLGADLRDVLSIDGNLYVTRFRTGDVLKLDGFGNLLSTSHVTTAPGTKPNTVAWRALPSAGGGVAILHQRATTGDVQVSPGGYGSSTCGPVTVAVSNIGGTLGNTVGIALPGAFHAVDFAIAKDGKSAVVVAPGGSHVSVGTQIYRVALDSPSGGCSDPASVARGRIDGEPTGVAFAADGRLVVQSRQPAALIIDGETVPLPGEDRIDTGHMIFHGGSGFGIACVSCHVEGGEDAVTWSFGGGIGKRRTQSLRGNVLSRAPFHWDGSLPTFGSLVEEVFEHRMLGPKLDPSQLAALARYIDSIPRLTPTEPSDAGLGRVVFEARCTGCHSGTAFTDGKLHDVGTGGLFKTPTLQGLWFRAPYLHDGCASTLEARFDRCGGGDAHGATSDLSETQKLNLVAYLQSL
jgi:hypothetical protein